MIEDDAFREEVEVSLRQATDGQLVRIMQFIERLPSRGRLDDVIAPMRGRLAMVRPVRSLTLGRVLTLPVEDLLVDVGHAGISPWVLPRDILSVFHQIGLSGLDRVATAALEQAGAGATMEDRTIVLELGRRLWPTAAATLRQFLSDERAGMAVLPDGFRPGHRAGLQGIADILDKAEEISSHLERLPPRPMPCLTADEQADAAALLTLAGAASPALLRYAFTILLRRTGAPAEMFSLLLSLEGGLAPHPAALVASESASESLMEVDLLCGELQDRLAAGDGIGGKAGMQVSACADKTARVALLIETLSQLPVTVGVDSGRLAELRETVAQAVMDCYSAVLLGPMRTAFFAVIKPAGCDGGAEADPATVGDAEATARAVTRIQEAGGRLGLGASMAPLCDQEIDGYRLSIAYRAAADIRPPGERVVGVMDGLRLVEILAGPAVAEAMIDQIVTDA